MKRIISLAVTALALMALSVSIAFAHDKTVTLLERSNSGQSGTATLSDMNDGTTKVTIELTNATTVAQPVHIHYGSCDALGEHFYDLNEIVNGRSETIVPKEVHEIANAGVAINAHKSAAEISVYVACGNVVAMDHSGEEADMGRHEPGMPRTGDAQSLLSLGLGALGALLLVTAGASLRRRAIR